MKFDLAIDARMIYHSGIGTYLRNILPGIVPHFRCALLGTVEQLQSFPWSHTATLIPLTAPIYSPREQWELFRRTPSARLFWSPHFNAPVLPVSAERRLVTIHDVFHVAQGHLLPWPHKWYAYFLMKNAAHRAHHILTVSHFSRTEIHHHLQVPLRKITVIPNGLDQHHFRPLPAEVLQTTRERYNLPELFFLFVGNFKPHKNLPRLLQAFHQIAEAIPEWHLVVLGKMEGFVTRDALSRTLLQQLPNIVDRVHFLGEVPYEQLPHFYNLASVFVFPSFYEGFGLPPLEAMACGCPVVASRAASIPEVCQDAALYFSPFDVDEMSQQLLQMAQSPDLRRTLKEKGLKRAQLFTWEKSQTATRAVIESLL